MPVRKKVLFIFVCFCCALLLVLITSAPKTGPAVTVESEIKEKAQLQEELGEALREYYIYGTGETECARLLDEIGR